MCNNLTYIAQAWEDMSLCDLRKDITYKRLRSLHDVIFCLSGGTCHMLTFFLWEGTASQPLAYEAPPKPLLKLIHVFDAN